MPRFTARRGCLAGASALAAASARCPGVSFAAANTDRRMIVLILRGGLDGLSLLAPYGDPDYARARGKLAVSADKLHPVNDLFGLHSSLETVAQMWIAGEATLFHAVGLPNTQRSHFEAQDMLEGGGAHPRAERTGWLNRALASQGGMCAAAAIGGGVPLILRGDAEVTAIDPGLRLSDRDELLDMLPTLYAADPGLMAALQQSMQTRQMLEEAGNSEDGERGSRKRLSGRGGASQREAGAVVGKLMADPGGPRVAVIEIGGWDTHANQAGGLSNRLSSLDAALAGIRSGLGEAWSKTALLAMTEFGRTVSANGTSGSDHGTASAAMLLGGAVRGGVVHADWPGLSAAAQFEGRDLKRTLDLRAVMKGVLVEHLGVSTKALDREVFPDSRAAAPLLGLINS